MWSNEKHLKWVKALYALLILVMPRVIITEVVVEHSESKQYRNRATSLRNVLAVIMVGLC